MLAIGSTKHLIDIIVPNFLEPTTIFWWFGWPILLRKGDQKQLFLVAFFSFSPSPLQTECLCPSEIHVEVLLPCVMVSGGGAFGR